MNLKNNPSTYTLLGLTPLLLILGELPSLAQTAPNTPLPSTFSEAAPVATPVLPQLGKVEKIAKQLPTTPNLASDEPPLNLVSELPLTPVEPPSVSPSLQKAPTPEAELEAVLPLTSLPKEQDSSRKVQKTISLAPSPSSSSEATEEIVTYATLSDENLEELETTTASVPTSPTLDELEELEREGPVSSPNVIHTSANWLQENPIPPTSADTSLQAQVDIQPGRLLNLPWSYVAVGFNTGLAGDTDIGNGSFALYSKIALSPSISVRPGVLLGENGTFLLPATYDFRIASPDPFEPSTLYPYFGGGVAYTTKNSDGNNIGPLLTGGLDFRLSDKIVVNGGFNLSYLEDQVELGFVLGVGYIFFD